MLFASTFSVQTLKPSVWLYARPRNTSLVTKDFLMTKCKPFLPSQSCTIIPLARQALLVENSPLGFYFCLIFLALLRSLCVRLTVCSLLDPGLFLSTFLGWALGAKILGRRRGQEGRVEIPFLSITCTSSVLTWPLPTFPFFPFASCPTLQLHGITVPQCARLSHSVPAAWYTSSPLHPLPVNSNLAHHLLWEVFPSSCGPVYVPFCSLAAIAWCHCLFTCLPFSRECRLPEGGAMDLFTFITQRRGWHRIGANTCLTNGAGKTNP